jgi:hypothetical protein
MLSATLTALSTYQSLRRYEELQSGWSWDLAYYNQWFWSVTHGVDEVTVRPVSAYAQEGPSIWKMNYLAPIRLAIAPFYACAPDPRTLLVIQCVVFWWVVPAAYSLVVAEAQSEIVALSAAALVALTPLLWPLVWDDFRELQLAGPFVLWAINGIRSRSVPLGALGIGGMLACRQEFAIMLATFCLLPPREPEALEVSLRWRRATLLGGTAWLLFGFFGYLRFLVGRGAPDAFIDQFVGPRGSFLGNGRVGFSGLSGAARRHPRNPLDLGALQRALGDAAIGDLGVASRSIHRAHGIDGAGSGLSRLRSAGVIAFEATARPDRPCFRVAIGSHRLCHRVERRGRAGRASAPEF